MPLDTPGDGSQKTDDTAAATATTTEGAESTDTPFVGTYKSREAAEAGIKESQATITRLQNELHQTRALADQSKAIRELAATVAQSTARPGESAEETEARSVALREEIDKQPGKMVDLVAKVATEQEAEFSRRLQAETEKLRKELTDRFGTVEKRLADTDSRYVANKDKIDALEKVGLTREQAMKALEVVTPDVMAPAASLPPGRMDSTRVTTKRPEPLVSAESRQALKERYGCTDEEIDNLMKTGLKIAQPKVGA